MPPSVSKLHLFLSRQRWRTIKVECEGKFQNSRKQTNQTSNTKIKPPRSQTHTQEEKEEEEEDTSSSSGGGSRQ